MPCCSQILDSSGRAATYSKSTKMAAAPAGSRSVAGVVSMKSPASGDDHGMERGTSAAQVTVQAVLQPA